MVDVRDCVGLDVDESLRVGVALVEADTERVAVLEGVTDRVGDLVGVVVADVVVEGVAEGLVLEVGVAVTKDWQSQYSEESPYCK